MADREQQGEKLDSSIDARAVEEQPTAPQTMFEAATAGWPPGLLQRKIARRRTERSAATLALRTATGAIADSLAASSGALTAQLDEDRPMEPTRSPAEIADLGFSGRRRLSRAGEGKPVGRARPEGYMLDRDLRGGPRYRRGVWRAAPAGGGIVRVQQGGRAPRCSRARRA